MAFSKHTFEFLRDLEANNTKEWFEANRDRYETHWKSAALDFIADMADAMQALDPALRAEPKLNGSLRRINRDVRFSKDKSPYNSSCHIVFWRGDHPNRSPGMHFSLRPNGVWYGAGIWGVPPGPLKAYRDRIVGGDRAALDTALASASAVGCDLGKPDLTRVPRGFEAEGKTADLLRYKGYVAMTREKPAPPSKIIGPGAAAWSIETTQALMPLIRWLVA